MCVEILVAVIQALCLMGCPDLVLEILLVIYILSHQLLILVECIKNPLVSIDKHTSLGPLLCGFIETVIERIHIVGGKIHYIGEHCAVIIKSLVCSYELGMHLLFRFPAPHDTVEIKEIRYFLRWVCNAAFAEIGFHLGSDIGLHDKVHLDSILCKPHYGLQNILGLSRLSFRGDLAIFRIRFIKIEADIRREAVHGKPY